MRLLPCLLLFALSASPALAGGTVAEADTAVGAPLAQAQPPGAQDTAPTKKRALACPACRTDEMPSFAIRPATGNGQTAAAAGAASPTGNGIDPLGRVASQPPVNFSFDASSNSYSNRNRYRGGVYMAAPF